MLNKFPLIIGGDHSVSLGSLSAIGSQHNNIGVFWIDAHADMNTPDTTPTGNIHGMVLASLQGLGNNLLTKIHSEKIKVKTENIVLFGTRDIDEGEGVLIDQLNVKNISYEKLKINYEKNVEESIKYMKSKTMEVHISLDIDSLNPMIAPGVSTPVSGGLDTKQLSFFLQNIFDNFNVVSMDIVEYNSLNDKGEATLKIIIDIIDFIEKKYAIRKTVINN